MQFWGQDFSTVWDVPETIWSWWTKLVLCPCKCKHACCRVLLALLYFGRPDNCRVTRLPPQDSDPFDQLQPFRPRQHGRQTEQHGDLLNFGLGRRQSSSRKRTWTGQPPFLLFSVRLLIWSCSIPTWRQQTFASALAVRVPGAALQYCCMVDWSKEN
jgi:hypothetical protein